MSEKQNRRWLYTKLKNYLWKIITPNAYGSLKRSETIIKELIDIIKTFEKNNENLK